MKRQATMIKISAAKHGSVHAAIMMSIQEGAQWCISKQGSTDGAMCTVYLSVRDTRRFNRERERPDWRHLTKAVTEHIPKGWPVPFGSFLGMVYMYCSGTDESPSGLMVGCEVRK